MYRLRTYVEPLGGFFNNVNVCNDQAQPSSTLRNRAIASAPGPIVNHINMVMITAEVTHQAQVAPMTKGSKNVR